MPEQPEPVVRFESLSSLCALMPRPQLVTGIVVSWLRQHFSQTPNIEDPKLQDTLWAAKIDTTKILVDSVYSWKPATTETRPGVFIKRGPWRVLRLGIDDRKMGGMPISGNRHYVSFIQGSHSIFCIAGAPAEAETLAAEVYRELVQFGPLFRATFNFLKFQITDVGEVSILEEARENFVVPITLAYATDDAWEIIPHVPVLKHVKLSAFIQ
jgi:hypothetical protein